MCTSSAGMSDFLKKNRIQRDLSGGERLNVTCVNSFGFNVTDHLCVKTCTASLITAGDINVSRNIHATSHANCTANVYTDTRLYFGSPVNV